MADGTIIVDEPAVTDKLLDTEELTVGANTVQRERVQIAGAAATDIAPVTAANGLDVDVTRVQGSVAVTNAGTFATQVDGSALTALQLIDDVVHSGDAALSKYAVVGAVFDDTAPVAVTENQAQSLRMTSARGLHVSIRDIQAGDTNIGNVDIASIAAGDNNIGNVDVLTIAAGDNNIGNVDIASIAAGDNNIGNVDVVSLPASTNTIEVVGDVAHGVAAAGNPLRIGAKAETALSGITLAADGNATDLYAGVDGVLIVRPHCNLEDVVQERATNTDGASTAFASGLAAPGATVRLWVTNVDICNSSASFVTVDLRDGSAGSVLWTLPVPATGGVVKNFNPPLKLTANTALAYDASAATTTLTISANGFKSKV